MDDGRIHARDRGPGTAAAIATAGTGLVLAALPVFLVGGLAVQVRADLGLGEGALGAVVAFAFLVGALVSPLAGRAADRLGATRTILLGATCSLCSAAGIGLLARSGPSLAAALAVSGVGVALTDPGLALLVRDRVPAGRQGLAFGTKEAAIPAATLLAGLAVPAISLTVGWRWAFLLVLPVLALLAGLLARTSRATPAPTPAPPAAPRTAPGTVTGTAPGRPAGAAPGPPVGVADGREPGPRVDVRALSVAAALGAAAASGVGVFLTDTAVARGLTPASAGLLLSLGSVAGVVARLGVGLLADRRRDVGLRPMAAMLAIGAVAMAIGALPGTPALVIGTLGTFGAGWAWSGLFFLGLLRLRPATVGAATGVGLAGLATGNALGPLAFGLLAESSSPSAAWLGAAVLAGVAATIVAVATRGR